MKYSDLRPGMILIKSQPDNTPSFKYVEEVEVRSLDTPSREVLSVIVLKTTRSDLKPGYIAAMRMSLENFEPKTTEHYDIF